MTYELSVNEYNALQEITRINNMDCWFCLRTDKQGKDYIVDLEEGKRISLKRALNDINEGLLEEDFFLLSNEERRALNNLFLRYRLPIIEEER